MDSENEIAREYDHAEARNALSEAIFKWIGTLGVDPVTFDYNDIETYLDSFEEDVWSAAREQL